MTASRSQWRLVRGPPTPPSLIKSASKRPATPSLPILRLPDGDLSAPTMNYFVRSSPTRKSELKLIPLSSTIGALHALVQSRDFQPRSRAEQAWRAPASDPPPA